MIIVIDFGSVVNVIIFSLGTTMMPKITGNSESSAREQLRNVLSNVLLLGRLIPVTWSNIIICTGTVIY